MLVTKTLLEKEIYSVAGPGQYKSKESKYKGILHTEEKDIEIQFLVSVDILKDFVSNIVDEITVNFLMPLGMFMKDIYPNLKKIEMTLIHSVVGSKTATRYKLVFTKLDQDILNGTYNNMDSAKMDSEKMTSLVAQLLYKEVEALRSETVYGIFKKVAPGDVMNVLMKNGLSKFGFGDGEVSKALKMITPDNLRKYEHIVIPSGTKLLDLPSFFQQKDYGLCNGGLGTYMHKSDGHELEIDNIQTCHTYPLYGHANITNDGPTLQIIAVPSISLSSTDSTYATDNGMLKIICKAPNMTSNNDDSKHMNEGVGLETADADAIMKRPVEVHIDKVITKKLNIKRQMLHKVMEDGINKLEHVKITSNFYNERSKVLRNDGEVIQFQWNFSNARFLIPGMKVTIITDDTKGGVNVDQGILHGVHIATDCNKKMEASILNIFVMNKKKEQ